MSKNYTIHKAPIIVSTNDGKRIAEHFEKVTDGNEDISIAHMNDGASHLKDLNFMNTHGLYAVKNSLLLMGK